MDSFYDAPRRPPAPPRISNIQRNPTVPEVSVIENSFYGPPRCFKPCDNPNKDSFLSMSKKQVRFQNPQPPITVFGKENQPDLRGKTFEQIYMANVPDRHLDLSVFEPCNLAPSVSPTQIAPLKSIENRPASSVYNTKPVVCTEIATPSDEPTIKDLFKIIQQQNEQIMLLQRQVNNLKTSIRQTPEIKQFDNQNILNSPTKKGVISIIDVKTANFEVLYHHPHAKNKKSEATIQEIMECDGGGSEQNVFLRLDGPVEVEDKGVSVATPSIHISMDGLHEYHSSEEEDEARDFGDALYNGLMNQINNALRMTSECPKQEVTGQTIKAVKQATLQHLKTIGVNLSPIQESNEITGGSDVDSVNYGQDDVSFAVKQLLMKYLPDDKLAQALHKEKPQPIKRKSKPPNSELSFATLQYLQKYNIIGNGVKTRQPDTQPKTPRFLDVTALKLQSKLDYKK